MIKTAIAGLGAIAKNVHLPLIRHQSELEIIAVNSSDSDKAATLLAGIPCFSNYQSLLQESDAELIVITTPNCTHFEMTLAALNAGKHVVVEKPVTTSPKEIEQLMAVAKKNNKWVIPFHNRRWDGDYLTVKKLLDEDSLGNIKLFESRFDRYRPELSDKWKEQAGQNSGLWFDIAPHLLDQAFELFGLPSAITARLLCTRENSQEVDYFNTQLHYPNKEIVIGASNFCAGPVRRFYIEGTKATFVKEQLDPQAEQLENKVQPNHQNYGIEEERLFGQRYDRQQNHQNCSAIETVQGSYPTFYQAVADCLTSRQAPPVNLEAALNVARFLQLGLLSQEQNKTVRVRQYRD